MLKKINENDFEKEISNSAKLVLVDFYASWCGPCQMLAPVLEKISNSRANFDILKIDVDEARKTAEKYKVEVVPTIIIFKEGVPVKQLEGYLDEEELLDIIDKYID